MKTNLIFLHGGPAYQDYLEKFFKDRFKSGFKTKFYTQTQAENISVELLVDELAKVVEATGEQVILVGHSWGGVLATEYVRRTKGDRVKGIVFISSYFSAEHVTTDYKRELEKRQLTDPTTEQIFFTSREGPFVKTLVTMLDATFNKVAFQKVWDGFVSTFDNRAFAKTMTLPLLNIFGSNDVRVPTDVSRSYGKLNAKFTNLEIRDAGHFPFIVEDDRKQVIEGIEKFAGKLSTS